MNARLISFGTTPTKYRNKPTQVDGITFASLAEANRYRQLKLLRAHGAIRNLELQPIFPIVVNGAKVGKYSADFRYERAGKGGAWTTVTEDVKGFETAVFRLKAKLVLALYGVRIELVRGR